MNQILNPLTFPLKGSALIEASAGTGKTFTLALLYLRLVLQHGMDSPSQQTESETEDQKTGTQAFIRPLLPPEILVVTFTNAATQELRERIRLRLVEMAELLQIPDITEDENKDDASSDDQLSASAGDPILLKLKASLIAQGRSPDAEARRLLLAAEWMDEASISTIHSWCYRVLTEHAFDSGNGFEQELIQSEADYLQQAAEDYWRSYCLSLDEASLKTLLSVFTSPASLTGKIRNLLPALDQLAVSSLPEDCQPNESEPGVFRLCSVEQLLATLQQEKAAVIQPLKQRWRDENYINQLTELFDNAQSEKRLTTPKLNKKHRGDLLAKLTRWLETDVEQTGINTGQNTFRRMAGLDLSAWKDEGDSDSQHPACLALRQLEGALAQLPGAETMLLEHSARWIRQRIEHEKQRQQQLYHNDLLTRLDHALQHPERGEALAEAIRRKFPVALVDEFQDTDPIQYRIFDRVYRVKEPIENTGFFMIGDPKQAIYAFRGADIYTYLKAGDAAQQSYTLDTNYRSCPELIDQVNEIFHHCERDHEAQGAFRMRSLDDSDKAIPFKPVKAGKSSLTGLVIDHQPVAAQQSWLTETQGVTAYRTESAQIAANEIARLLVLGQQGKATLPDADNPEQRQPVQPRDIAVLVNNGTEAREIEEALYKQGVASVYLSDRSSVYASDTAASLLVMMRAVAHPLNERWLRQALGCPLAGFSVQQLEQLNRNEFYWETQIEHFTRLQRVWRFRGILALIYQLIEQFDIARRLLSLRGGERQLTDLLHLGELLQHASEQVEGELALIRFLEEARLEPDENSDVQQQRLESDRELVKIVTIHKSKGLEYPLVFLPFICNFRREEGRYRPVLTHNAKGDPEAHLALTPDVLQQADDERLGEDIRKLYVALTRARYGNWLGMAPLKQLEHSALGHLLGLNQDSLTTQTLSQSDWLKRFSLMQPTEEQWQYRPPVQAELDQARICTVKPAPGWWVASYSAISYGARSEALSAQSSEPDQITEEETAAESTAREEAGEAVVNVPVEFLMPPLTNQTRSLHQFPAGSRSGTFLHGILEWAAEQKSVSETAPGTLLYGFNASAADQALRLETLHKRCHMRQLTEWVYPLDNWLKDYLSTPWILDKLPDSDGNIPTFALKDLQPSQICVEMEFLFQSHHVNSLQLDKLVIASTLNQASRPMAQKTQLNGLMKGFIDLVMEYQGRYYVVDWKSNKLGEHDEAYHHEAMTNAILEKRYDLQYCIYLLALHRQLKARLPDYDYDRHIGGVVYAFLRGNQSQSQGLFMDRPDKYFIEQLDRLFLGKGVDEYEQETMSFKSKQNIRTSQESENHAR